MYQCRMGIFDINFVHFSLHLYKIGAIVILVIEDNAQSCIFLAPLLI